MFVICISAVEFHLGDIAINWAKEGSMLQAVFVFHYELFWNVG